MSFLIFIFNFIISWFNAWSCGRSWNTTSRFGGFPHFMTWCGIIMSASGFTWCYMAIIGLVALATDSMKEQDVRLFWSMGYLILILPILGSGLAITIDSWRHFLKNRRIGNLGIAAYNSYAQYHNSYQAVKAVPSIARELFDVFFRKDDRRSSSSSKHEGNLAIFMIALVLLALFGGILTTLCIVRRTARHNPAV